MSLKTRLNRDSLFPAQPRRLDPLESIPFPEAKLRTMEAVRGSSCSSFPFAVLVAVTLKLVSIFSRFSAELIAATVASNGEPLPNG